MPRALPGFAGPRALVHLRERGLKPADVRVIPAAAGGPKGLILNPLDRQTIPGAAGTLVKTKKYAAKPPGMPNV